MMIGGKRNCGKTTELIKKSNEKHLYIITSNSERAKYIANLAKHLKLDIPFPITIKELPLRSSYIKEVLVDDVEDILTTIIKKPILMASTSMELKDL